jgi:osmotically-inducible protein OsmY
VSDVNSYSIDGKNVILQRAVTQPYVKSGAENAVKSVEGVSNVINNIKVLPVSSEDEGVRRDEVR